MTGLALDLDGDGVAGGVQLAVAHLNGAHVHIGLDVQADGVVHVGVLAAAFLHHTVAAANGLLSGLEEQLDGAGQLFAHVLAQLGNAQQDGGVDVVAAGVHDAVVLGAIITGTILLQGQGVDVGAQAHHVAGLAAADDTHDAGVSAGLVLDAPLGQQSRDALLGLQLLGAQLGILMQFPANGNHFFGNGFDVGIDFHKNFSF